MAGDDGLAALCPNCGGAGRAPMKVRRVPFDYCFPTLTIPQGLAATFPLSLQLDDDSFFEQTHWQLCSGNLSQVNGSAFLVQIVDQSNGWQFSNAPIMFDNFATVGYIPFPLVSPYIWRPSSQAQATITVTINPGKNDNPQLVMRGYKLFAPDGSPLAVAA